MFPILSKELLNSSIFERIDTFKIVKTNTSKNKIGIRERIEILLKIKSKYAKKNAIERIITAFLNTEIIAKE